MAFYVDYDAMKVHLCKPGGQREGPFSIDQINQDLAARKYRDDDYWAWYDGLDAWVPLHTIPGIRDRSTEMPPPPGENSSSALPVEALEHIFIFTQGEGPAMMKSKAAASMLKSIIGVELETIRERVPRDVFGRCIIPVQLATEGRVPASAWRAMSALQPDLVKQAHDGSYRTCVRIFQIESGEKAAVFLFYNKSAIPAGN